MAHPQLGDLLVSSGVISQEQLGQALARQKETKKRLGEELIDDGIITEQQLIDTLRLQLGIEFVDLSAVEPDPQLVDVLPRNIAKKYGVTPVRLHGNTLYLAMSDPLNFMAQEEVRAATHRRVVPMITTADGIERANASLYGGEGAQRAIRDMRREAPVTQQGSTADAVVELNETAAPTVRLVNSIIERAAAENASDIHLDPCADCIRVRMRVDGVMCPVMTVPSDLYASVLARLKIMGGMDVTERRVPQDGRAGVRLRNRSFDLRMSTLPTIYGEKCVIRVLDKNSDFLSRDGIGVEGRQLEQYEYLMGRPSGTVLIVGPTGSGKTSTMYTMIHQLNSEQVNLLTLEDPVEYNIDGINQVQINEKTGMTFAGGLRSILRQDPDIIAVGEIRDGETAEIAMRAAITGHLVLATVHTNDALSTVERLKDIGVPNYLIAGALNGIISQRLVRVICPDCKQSYDPTAQELAELGLSADSKQKLFRGRGCPTCFGRGYRGRTAVFEMLVLSRRLRSAIAKGKDREELRSILRQEGNYTTLQENCRRLVQEGVTTIEEARRLGSSVEYDE